MIAPSRPAAPVRSAAGSDGDDEPDDVPADAWLARLIDAIPELAGPGWRAEPLAGGLTNRNYEVTSGAGRHVVVRFSAGKSELLAIDREAEYRSTVAAAQSGVGPRVVHYSPDDHVLVVEWIDGRTFADADLDDSRQLVRVAEACRRLHAGPRLVRDFDMFAIQAGYLEVVLERGFRLPADYLDRMPDVDRIGSALSVLAEPTVPCHNDLLPANMIDTPAAVRFIDYEYAGNNDACFELGNIASEAHLSHDRLAELVAAYYGSARRALFARARLYALMSNFGWTLWASIQDAVSEVDFDFWAWGSEKYERAVAEFDGGELESLINAVQQAT